jgi:hypothetical protein
MNGRTIDGRFTQGHKFAQGNENAKKMHALRRSLLEATTEESVKAVWATVEAQAREGCTVSQKLFLEMTCGKPVTPIEVSGPDEGPIWDRSRNRQHFRSDERQRLVVWFEVHI